MKPTVHRHPRELQGAYTRPKDQSLAGRQVTLGERAIPLAFCHVGARLAATEDDVCHLEPVGNGAGLAAAPRTVTDAERLKNSSNKWGREWKSISAVIRTHMCDFPPQLV